MSATEGARRLFDEAKYNECISTLSRLHPENRGDTPEARAVINLRALCLLRKGDADASIPLFDEVLAHDAADVTAIAGRRGAMMVVSRRKVDEGNDLFKNGDFEAALAVYGSVVVEDMDPSTAFSLGNNRGALLVRLGRFEEALDSFETSLQQAPSNVDTIHNKGLALKALGRFEEALEAFEKCVAFDSGYYSAICGKSETLTALSRYEEAIASADAAIKARAGESRGYSSRGFARLKSSDYSGAVADLEKAKALGNSSAEFEKVYGLALALLGDEYLSEKKYQDAISCYTQALSFGSADRPSPDLLFNLALAELTMGRVEEALQGLKHALEIQPEHYNATAALGLHLVNSAANMSDEAREAVRHLTKALELRPQEAEIAFHLGVAQIKSGEYNRASEAFEKTLRINPNHQQAIKALSAVNGQLAIQAAGLGGRPSTPTRRVQNSKEEEASFGNSDSFADCVPHRPKLAAEMEGFDGNSSIRGNLASIASMNSMDQSSGALVSLCFRLDELQFPGPYPEGIKIWSREQYLDDSEFEDLFGMPKEAFSKLAKWRQQAKKKELKLW